MSRVSEGETSQRPVEVPVLIEREGIIRRIWARVSVDGHVDEILAALESLQS